VRPGAPFLARSLREKWGFSLKKPEKWGFAFGELRSQLPQYLFPQLLRLAEKFLILQK
jgi:hypothetical protein